MGQSGEIAVKGPTLMLGYLGTPLDETLDSEGFFHTGDGGHLDANGRLFWEGRIDDMIKVRGALVSPVEVDGKIRKYSGVKQCQTVGVPHKLDGEWAVTCVVPQPGFRLEEQTIRDFAKQTLASFKVPIRVLFFDNDFETTGNSKILTRTLRGQASERLATEAAARAKESD